MSSKIQSYNENYLSVQQNVKNENSSRKHQTKKQVFGEIKNVIHNQGIATPLKPDQTGHRSASSMFISPANVKLKRQIRNEYKSSSSVKSQIRNSTRNNEFENFYFENLDFRECCCRAHKNDQEIWSEMNLYDDLFLDKILNSEKLKEEDDFCKAPNEKEDSEFFDIKDEPNFISLPKNENFEDVTDIHLLLEKPLFLDFSF